MGEFLSYSITSGLLLLMMYLAYRLFMASDNQHAWNRGVLLGVYALAFLMLPVADLLTPLFTPHHGGGELPVAGFITDVKVAVVESQRWGTALIWIYICGMVAVGARTLLTWARIARVVSRGEKTDMGNYTLVLTDDDRLAPFSWHRYMVMSRSDYMAAGATIAAHELRHIECHHWIDLLVAQIVLIINWFNPAAWLMRDELMLVHEYQADMAVIESGHNAKEYQLLLIKKAVGARFPSLANSLNHSKLKKRITMMYKSKSRRGARMKVVALAPAVALALCVAAMPQVKAAISTISNSEVIAGKDSEKSAGTEITAANFKVRNLNNNDGETTVVVTGTGLGNSLSVEDATLTNGGKTYSSKGVSCELVKGEATITYTFPSMTEFDDVSLDMEVNGSKVRIDMNPFFDNSSDVIVVAKGDDESEIPTIYIDGKQAAEAEGKADFPTIYIDGKLATEAEMKMVSPAEIESVDITKSQNGSVMNITLRK